MSDYKVVTAPSKYQLESKVNSLIRNGYEPVGSMTISSSTELLVFTDTEYGQAMLKKD